MRKTRVEPKIRQKMNGCKEHCIGIHCIRYHLNKEKLQKTILLKAHDTSMPIRDIFLCDLDLGKT